MAKLSKSRACKSVKHASSADETVPILDPSLDEAFELFSALQEAEHQQQFASSFFDSRSAKSRIINEYFQRGFAQA